MTNREGFATFALAHRLRASRAPIGKRLRLYVRVRSELAPEPPPINQVHGVVLIGGIWELFYQPLIEGKVAELPDLEDLIVDVLLGRLG